MVIEEALMSYLLGYSSLNALVSNRIYFLKLPQAPVLPAIVLQKISAPRIHGFSADTGATTRIQATAWATTYSGVSAVFEQLRASLQNYMNQTMGGAGGLSVKNVELDDENDAYEDDTGRYGKIADFLIWHTEV